MQSRLFVVLAASFAAGVCLATISSCSSTDRPGALPVDTDSGIDSTLDDVVTVDTRRDDVAPKDVVTDTAPSADAKPLCPTAYVDDEPTAVDYAHGASDIELLAAITWDERTMAWTTEESGTIVVHYADRAAKNDAFTGARTLPTALGPFADDKVALSADGLTMYFVSDNHEVVTQITRASRDVAFDAATASTKPFRSITGKNPDGLPTPKLADLVLSKDGKWLFYTDLLRTKGSSLMLSLELADGTWDKPNPIDAPRVQMEAGFHRRPTGLSADKLSLFYFDEVSEACYVAFREPGSSVSFDGFYGFSPTGRRAMPTDSCDRVYLSYESPGDRDAGKDSGGLEAGSDGDAAADDPPTVTHIVHAP